MLPIPIPSKQETHEQKIEFDQKKLRVVPEIKGVLHTEFWH